MKLLTEDEAKQVIRAYGWTPHVKPIARGRYLYAARKQAGKVKDKYIAPIEKLERMTESEIVAKLS